MRLSTSSRIATASRTYGPLFSMTHSARSAIAASVNSRARVGSLSDEVVEDVCRPDHRHLCRLAEPEDLLLHLGETDEADLDGEIAAGDHHGQGLCPGALHDDLGQLAGSRSRFRSWPRSQLAARCPASQLVLEAGDVVGRSGRRSSRRCRPRVRRCRGRRDPWPSAGRGSGSCPGSSGPCSGRSSPFDSTRVTRRRAASVPPSSTTRRILPSSMQTSSPSCSCATASGREHSSCGGSGFPFGSTYDELESVADANAHLAAASSDPAGSCTGALEVDQDPARPSSLLGRPACVGRHRRPGFRRVVRAVDAHDVCTLLNECADERIVLRRLGRKRDHDPDLPVRRGGPEHRPCVTFEQAVTAIERLRPRM